MYIIVVGGGIVGYGIGLELQVMAGHEVTIIERDAARADELREELGEMIVTGDGSEVALLAQVGCQRADLLIAVTSDDGANLVACQIAKHRFEVNRTIARVNDPRNEELFRLLGIDSTVSASQAVMAQLETTLPEHTVVPLMSLSGSGLKVVDLHLQDGAPAAGRPLQEIVLPDQTIISLVVDQSGPRVPDGNTVLHVGDEVIAVIPVNAEETMRELITGRPEPA